jgi:tellurite resistance-related uncharacterized protein
MTAEGTTRSGDAEHGDGGRLPDAVELVRTTTTFNERTVPTGLLSAHALAANVWGRLVVETGGLRFVFEDDASGARQLVAGDHEVIPPARPHHLRLDGAVTFHIEFHR